MLTFFAIGNPAVSPFKDFDPAKSEVLFGKLFSGIIGLLLFVATIWAFVQLLQGGLSWISSAGDKGKLEEAKNRLLNAIIGLGIVFAAWAIFLVILQFFGISTPGGGFGITIPTLFE